MDVRLLLRSALVVLGLTLVVATGGAAYGEPADGTMPAESALVAAGSSTAEYVVIALLLAGAAASLVAAERVRSGGPGRPLRKR
jgi:hypothetical protein